MKSQWSNQVFQTWISEDSSAVVNLLLRQYSAMLMQFEQRTPDFIQVFIDIYTNISRKEIKFKVSVGTRLFWLHNTNCKSVQQSDKNRLRLHLSQQKELWLDKPVAWVSDTEVCGRKWKADKFNNVWSHNLVWLKGEKNRKGRKKEEGERKGVFKRMQMCYRFISNLFQWKPSVSNNQMWARTRSKQDSISAVVSSSSLDARSLTNVYFPAVQCLCVFTLRNVARPLKQWS